jgi:nucleoside-diphosphate-sugar epimerase
VKVLVTGSSGQLGAEVVRQLGGAAVGLDLKHGPGTTHLGNLCDRGKVSELVRGVEAIVHTASLHAPHVRVWSKQDFVDVNIAGTLTLLEAAAAAGVKTFIYTSTTSLYGAALEPRDEAVWVTEELTPRARDIYDATKIAAEDLCRVFAREKGMTIVSLRVSRFFDEGPEKMAVYRLFRGGDVRDFARAHLDALEKAKPGFEVFNISARSPFWRSETRELLENAPAVIARHFPKAAELFAARKWKLPERIDRVYVIDKAARDLGYQPRHNFLELC